ncbi:hypothetical protein AX14_006412 [Amanita brunnescens Koide BX004]|nr:hypothetical protein AX14_006412 [Amanita brunnescens Koide BX004]
MSMSTDNIAAASRNSVASLKAGCNNPGPSAKTARNSAASKEAGHSQESIVIPLPCVPGMSKTSLSQVSSAKQLVAHRGKADDDSDTADDCESSVTESDDPWPEDEDAESDESDEGDSDDENTNVLGNKSVARPLTAAEKRFMAEQVFWSEKENNPPPSSSSTTPIITPKFVINGEHIDISDNDNGADNSPTPLAVPPNSPANICKVLFVFAVPLLKKELADPLRTTNISNLASVNPALVAQALWPTYTDIVTLPKSKEILLSIQMYELKLVIRKAMILVEGRIRFDHAFPSPADRSVWNRLALAEACTVLESISHSPNVKVKYNWIQQHVEVDDQYVSDISTILDPRVSLLQGDSKAAAAINVCAAYGLHGGSARLVQRLLQQKQYIYPPALHGDGFLRDRPFEHNAIIGTLHDDLFSGYRSVVRIYPDRYKPGEENSYALTPSMVALAATAVFASLKEWETGPRIPTHFTMNVFAEVYRGHIEDLAYIEQRNEPAYKALLRRLSQMASGFGSSPLNNTVIDVDNMPIDV